MVYLGTVFLGFSFVFDREVWRLTRFCSHYRFDFLYTYDFRDIYSSQKNAKCRKTI